MQLTDITREELLAHITEEQMSIKKYGRLCGLVRRQDVCSMAFDDKYVIVKVGSRVGVAKRCTYKKKEDKFNLRIGVSIALSRAMK